MISGASLSALVLADHVARYPESMAATRQNTLTGVALHRPVEELVRALCNGLASAMSQLRVADTVAGTANVPGVSVPVPYSFTAIPQAKAAFLAASGWVGADASGAADTFIVSPLTRLPAVSALAMDTPLATVGTGTGIVSSASNPALLAAATGLLNRSLLEAFQASGFFGTDDVPGSPVNRTLAATLPGYATGLATGVASVFAQVAYVGPAGATTPSAGVNSGGFIGV